MPPLRGGKRPGAGRKPAFNETTKPVRIPLSQIPAVVDFIKQRTHPREALPHLTLAQPCELAPRIELPLFSSAIRAGFPSPADDYQEMRLDLNDLVHHKEATYYAWVEGDSMIDFNIHDGDLLMIDRAFQAEAGDIVVAEVDGQFTVKQLAEQQGCGLLLAGNPDYPPIIIHPENGVTLWGVVIRVIHDLRRNKRRRAL